MDSSLLNRAAPPGSMRYFAGLYAPPNTRKLLQATYAIESEIRESVISSSHEVAHTRLRWWREEIERLQHGNPQHPATRILANSNQRLDWTQLQQLVYAADIELSRMTFDTDRELQGYLERSGGVVQEVVAQLINPGESSDELRMHARRLGARVRHAEVLRDLYQEAYAGRIYIPMDELNASRLSPQELTAASPSAALRELIAAQARRSLDELQSHERQLTGVERARLRPVLVMAALYARLLQRLAQGEYSRAPPLQLGSVERAWTAWRAALKTR